MADSNKKQSINLFQIIEILGAEKTDAVKDFSVRTLAALDKAQSDDISFLTNPKYKSSLSSSNAGAILISKKLIDDSILNAPLVIVEDAYLALALLLQKFHPPVLPERGIHPAAVIHPTSQIGKNVCISANAVVGENCAIGDNTALFPGVAVGSGTKIGKNCIIYPNATIYHDVTIGNSVIIHAGAVIGSDGFGFARKGAEYVKIPQIGNVVIEDDVEIGANSTIDRGSMGRTVISRGVKLDNLVHLAHNVQVGEHTAMAALTGVSGSTTIGNRCIIAGQVGIAGHIQIGDDVVITAKAGIMKSVDAPKMWSGFPHMEHRQWRKTHAAMRHIVDLQKEVKRLTKEIDRISRAVSNDKCEGKE